jgi:YVTN family beta-propeller protein
MPPHATFGSKQLQVVAFGDSLLDAGTQSQFAKATFNGGRFTTNPGENFTQDIALHYGDKLTPAFVGGFSERLVPAGGLAHAQGGSFVTMLPGIDHAPLRTKDADFAQASTVPIKDQVSAYLASATATVHHYEYVVNDGSLTVYDIDVLPQVSVVKTKALPNSGGTRGAVGCHDTLWVSYGSDKTQRLTNTPTLLAYDLVNDIVKWTRTYSFGIDSMSVTSDCSKIYMPEGELSTGGRWYVIDAATGDPTGASVNSTGVGPHNTIIPASTEHIFMGSRFSAYLVEGSIASNSVLKQIGPVTAGSSTGIRPFTIDGSESMAFVTLTGYLGFQVFNIKTGALLHTVPVPGYSCSGGVGASSCSHGISLSPNGKEIYLIDTGNTANHVHVFDVSRLPGAAPTLLSTITLKTSFSGNEAPCAYDCVRDGWIHHSLDGKYVFVGDSGDVIDTATRSVIATLPAMRNSRKEIEIDFQNGNVVAAMRNRSSIGE